MSECDLTDAERFMALMILHRNFRTKILNAVKNGKEQDVRDELTRCNINLTNQEIKNIMDWDDNTLLEGYRQIIDISKDVYDPGAGNW